MDAITGKRVDKVHGKRRKLMQCASCQGMVVIKHGWHSCQCGKLSIDVGHGLFRVLGNAVEDEQGRRIKEVEDAN